MKFKAKTQQNNTIDRPKVGVGVLIVKDSKILCRLGQEVIYV